MMKKKDTFNPINKAPVAVDLDVLKYERPRSGYRWGLFLVVAACIGYFFYYDDLDDDFSWIIISLAFILALGIDHVWRKENFKKKEKFDEKFEILDKAHDKNKDAKKHYDWKKYHLAQYLFDEIKSLLMVIFLDDTKPIKNTLTNLDHNVDVCKLESLKDECLFLIGRSDATINNNIEASEADIGLATKLADEGQSLSTRFKQDDLAGWYRDCGEATREKHIYIRTLDYQKSFSKDTVFIRQKDELDGFIDDLAGFNRDRRASQFGLSDLNPMRVAAAPIGSLMPSVGPDPMIPGISILDSQMPGIEGPGWRTTLTRDVGWLKEDMVGVKGDISNIKRELQLLWEVHKEFPIPKHIHRQPVKTRIMIHLYYVCDNEDCPCDPLVIETWEAKKYLKGIIHLAQMMKAAAVVEIGEFLNKARDLYNTYKEPVKFDDIMDTHFLLSSEKDELEILLREAKYYDEFQPHGDKWYCSECSEDIDWDD